MPTSRTARLTGPALTLALGASLLVNTPSLADGDEPHPHHEHSTASSQVALDWQRTSIRTVYTENASTVPAGALYLGFASLAMNEAARRSERAHSASSEAAVAVAAHDVLATYFPASAANLDADLSASLGDIADGNAKARGMAKGARAADRLIATRADDGRDDTSIVYAKPPAIGVWQPAPGGSMLVPWVGFVDPLVVRHIATAPGPEDLSSAEWAADYDETRRLGAAVGSERTAEQTATALFFNSNAATMLTEGVLRWLDDHMMSLRRTTQLFAAMHAAEADSIIAAWRQKFDVGFWRPVQAVALADLDGNSATTPQPGWTPLLPTPPYSEYVSGHAATTSPAAEVIRHMLGDDTTLTLHSYNTNSDRTYASISAIEADALNSRIWGGLHFRAAMDDGYAMGHSTAREVLRRLADRCWSED
ncbi:MAG: vanadium-dependent haloperoxidase [Ornithinibacter sp.]